MEGGSWEPRGPEAQRPPPAAVRDEAESTSGLWGAALGALGSVRRHASVAFSQPLGGTLL